MIYDDNFSLLSIIMPKSFSSSRISTSLIVWALIPNMVYAVLLSGPTALLYILLVLNFNYNLSDHLVNRFMSFWNSWLINSLFANDTKLLQVLLSSNNTWSNFVSLANKRSFARMCFGRLSMKIIKRIGSNTLLQGTSLITDSQVNNLESILTPYLRFERTFLI